jgi:hypothetical protein
VRGFAPCYVSSRYFVSAGVKNWSPYYAMMMVSKILLLNLVSDYDLARIVEIHSYDGS